MRIIKRAPLIEFGQRFPGAIGPLDAWYRITLASNWSNFAEVKATFGQVDWVKVQSGNSVLVFDIGGNKFRLVAGVSFQKSKVYVLRIMTHKEYDKAFWKEQL